MIIIYQEQHFKYCQKLSINDNITFLENIKQRFKKKYITYRSQITIQPKTKYLYYQINPTFKKIKILFVHSFKDGNNDPTKNSFDEYYIPLIEIKDFIALIDKPVKHKQEAYEKRIEMSQNDDHTTGILSDLTYHQNYYKLIGISLSRQRNKNFSQQINFTGKLEEDDSATMYFFAEK